MLEMLAEAARRMDAVIAKLRANGIADTDIRIQAVYLLEAYADPRTVGQLVGMLRDPDWWVRETAIEAARSPARCRSCEP